MMDSRDLVLALRREQIAVLHAVRSAVTPGGRRLVVVFLEASHGQADQASACLRRLPDVHDVTFARHTRAIMYVFLDRGTELCATARPG
jgi:hypothetical protein